MQGKTFIDVYDHEWCWVESSGNLYILENDYYFPVLDNASIEESRKWIKETSGEYPISESDGYIPRMVVNEGTMELELPNQEELDNICRYCYEEGNTSVSFLNCPYDEQTSKLESFMFECWMDGFATKKALTNYAK